MSGRRDADAKSASVDDPGATVPCCDRDRRFGGDLRAVEAQLSEDRGLPCPWWLAEGPEITQGSAPECHQRRRRLRAYRRIDARRRVDDHKLGAALAHAPDIRAEPPQGSSGCRPRVASRATNRWLSCRIGVERATVPERAALGLHRRSWRRSSCQAAFCEDDQRFHAPLVPRQLFHVDPSYSASKRPHRVVQAGRVLTGALGPAPDPCGQRSDAGRQREVRGRDHRRSTSARQLAMGQQCRVDIGGTTPPNPAARRPMTA